MIKRYLVLPWLDIAVNQARRPLGGELFVAPEIRINLSPGVDVDAILPERVVEVRHAHHAVISVIALDTDQPHIAVNRLWVVVLRVWG